MNTYTHFTVAYPEHRESKTPDDAVFKHLALTYSQNHPEMRKGDSCRRKFKDGITNGAAWYSFAGGMQDYNYAFRGCMEVTLEISCCKYPPVSLLQNLLKQNINVRLILDLHSFLVLIKCYGKLSYRRDHCTV